MGFPRAIKLTIFAVLILSVFSDNSFLEESPLSDYPIPQSQYAPQAILGITFDDFKEFIPCVLKGVTSLKDSVKIGVELYNLFKSKNLTFESVTSQIQPILGSYKGAFDVCVPILKKIFGKA